MAFNSHYYLSKIFQSKYSILYILLILLITGALIYSNTLNSPFTLDDYDNFVKNPKIKKDDIFTQFNMPRYISIITFAINYRIHGFKLPGYHIVNILIHIINSFLIYIVAFRIISITSGKTSTLYQKEISLIISLIFLVHPVQTQAVTYIVQRMTSLSATFAIASILLYMAYRTSVPRRLRLYILSLLACLLAYKTKENTATIPLVICAIEFIILRNQDNLRKKLLRILPLYIIPYFILISVILLSFINIGKPAANLVEDIASVSHETLAISRTQYLLTQLRVIVTYMRLLILPIHQSIDYHYPLSESLFDMKTFLALCFNIFMIIASLILARKYSFISFGLLWFYIFLGIESSIIPILDVIFEHRIYLPSAGFIMAFAGVLMAGEARFKRAFAVPLMILFIILLAIATFQRNKIWKDEVTLWGDCVKKFPEKQRCYASLGIAYHKLLDFDKAIELYKKALEMNPRDKRTHHNLATCYEKRMRIDEAIEELTLALQIDPNYKQAYYGLALKYMYKKDINTAFNLLMKAPEIDSNDPLVNAFLADLLCQKGDMQQADELFNNAIQNGLDKSESFFNYALCLYHKNRTKESHNYFRKTIELEPGFIEAYFGIGLNYERDGDLIHAAEYYRIFISKSKENTPLLEEAKMRLKRIESTISAPNMK